MTERVCSELKQQHSREIKVATDSEVSLAIQFRTMNQTNIFVDTINMETQTVFQNNGTINIYPCDFEQGQQILAGGMTQVRQKGRMVTNDDGTSRFIPYRKNSGYRYELLEFSDHGEMKASQKEIIFRFAFPKKWSMEKIFEELRLNVNQLESNWNSWNDFE